ncbi:MAG: hypothetical protein WD069_20950 [Planctomycetales bacterium]
MSDQSPSPKDRPAGPPADEAILELKPIASAAAEDDEIVELPPVRQSPQPLTKERTKAVPAKKGGGNRVGGLIARIVIYGAVVALAVVVGLDVRARRAAQGTANAWDAALANRNSDEKDLDPSELKSLASGSPTVRAVAEDELPKYRPYSAEEYVWWGPYREHVVRVVVQRVVKNGKEHRSVVRFDVPGDDEE